MKGWQVTAIAIAVALLVLVIGIAAAGRAGYNRGKAEAIAGIKTDTVVVTRTVRDTIRVPEPKYIAVKVTDTLYVPVAVPGDTVTVFVPLPKEQRYYEDADYRAWVSGFEPALDSLQVFPVTKYVEKTVTVEVPTYLRKRWGLGLVGGYGIAPADNGIKGVPFVGIGISYSLIQW